MRRASDTPCPLHRVIVGRWCLSYQQFPVRRFARRRGGRLTPHPWWQITIPGIGAVSVDHDRTLFGLRDEVNQR